MKSEEFTSVFDIKTVLRRPSITSHGKRHPAKLALKTRGKTAVGDFRNSTTKTRQSSSLKQSSWIAVSPRSPVKVTFPEEEDVFPDANGTRRHSITPNVDRRLSGPVLRQSWLSNDSYRSRRQSSIPSRTLGTDRRGSIPPSELGQRRGSTYRRLSSKSEQAILRKKTLLAKFRLAVKLTIFCARNFKQHCLRINEQQDELAPFIRRLHFHEDDNPDLLIDLSKFKANRQLRIPDETKRILSKEVGERTEHEIYSVTVALRNIKSYGEYPNRMQKKIAEVGLYEKYESKRVIVRQNHPATAFYFILSGAVVVMVMDEETKFARPVAHLYKGQTFGELAIINSSKRNSTVIAKETCEFLSISVQDYHKIFMAGGVKNISDPDQEIFLKSLKCLASWPIHILPQHPNKCQFLFFKNADVIIRDSSISEWIIIVKSGSVQVLKKLRKVDAFGWKKKKQEPVTLADKREVILKQTVFRKILPELQIPLNPDLEDEPVNITSNGRPLPFKHPNDRDDTESVSSSQPSSSRVPNLWPFSVDLSQMESGRYLEDEYRPGMHRKPTETDLKSQSRKLKRSLSDRLAMKPRNRSDSIINEEEKELGGFQPHIRTIQEDLDPSAKHKDHDVDESVNLNPEFVLVHTLTKGQVFGLSDLIIGDQPSFSVVSKGADCILINKQFYMEHASDKLRNEMRQELCPYPTEEELQQGLQDSVDWHAYRKTMLLKSLSTVGSRRHMRATIRGTKVQEAY